MKNRPFASYATLFLVTFIVGLSSQAKASCGISILADKNTGDSVSLENLMVLEVLSSEASEAVSRVGAENYIVSAQGVVVFPYTDGHEDFFEGLYLKSGGQAGGDSRVYDLAKFSTVVRNSQECENILAWVQESSQSDVYGGAFVKTANWSLKPIRKPMGPSREVSPLPDGPISIYGGAKPGSGKVPQAVDEYLDSLQHDGAPPVSVPDTHPEVNLPSRPSSPSRPQEDNSNPTSGSGSSSSGSTSHGTSSSSPHASGCSCTSTTEGTGPRKGTSKLQRRR